MSFRAAVCRELGPPSVLKIEDMPARALREGEIRIRLRACGVNFPDLLMVAGKYQFKPDLPFVPGFESAGDVIEAAPGAQARVGDKVVYRSKTGGFAEQAIAGPQGHAPMPAHLSYAEAATFYVGFLTAHHALATRGQLQAGEKLLVTGAAGGVGMAAVALGGKMGAEVIAVVSTDEKCAAARKAGAAHAINSSTTRVDEAVKAITGGRGVDCLYDPVGLAADVALRALTFGGRILIVGFAGDVPVYAANRVLIKGVSVIGLRAGEYGRHFPEKRAVENESFARLTDGLKPHIGAELPLNEAAKALEMLQNRQAIGRIVLTP